MGMIRLGILHIADLHFGFETMMSGIKKDPISAKLKGQLSQDDPREIFLRKILPLLGKQQVDVLAFTGDAGSGDDLAAMCSGINYLSKIKDRLNITPEHVIIAPGNHDLDRMADDYKEFVHLIGICEKRGFTFATREKPGYIKVKGIPILPINTCLGATERAFHGLPEDFWATVIKVVKKFGDLTKDIKSEIPEAIKTQLKAMDIPAVGRSQFDSIDEYLISSQGNCAVVLGHHNPLPTHQLVIRPYAEIIDAGELIFNLIANERRILFLHGHTHCDTTLIAKSPEELDSGFIACLGGNGLHRIPTGSVASASFVRILADDKANFLCAIVYRFQQRGVNFIKNQSFAIWDDVRRTAQSDIQIDMLDPRTTFSFDEVSKKLNVSDPDTLAIELMKHRNLRQISISDVDRSMEDWQITRNA